jgi:hypothetical protein
MAHRARSIALESQRINNRGQKTEDRRRKTEDPFSPDGFDEASRKQVQGSI